MLSAKARTLSMFTGKTDAEDPTTGRDGSPPEGDARRSKLGQWHPSGSAWSYPFGGELAHVSPVKGGWLVIVKGERIGIAASLGAAGLMAERKLGDA